MHRLIFDRSIQYIPRSSGFVWIKAKNDKSQTVTVWASHSHNVYEAVRLSNKSEWLKDDLVDHWVEVLLDEDIILAA